MVRPEDTIREALDEGDHDSEALAALAVLVAERTGLQRECLSGRAEVAIERHRAEAAVADRDRYEKALRDLAEMPPPMPNKSAAVSQCHYLKEIARVALAPISEVPDDGQATTRERDEAERMGEAYPIPLEIHEDFMEMVNEMHNAVNPDPHHPIHACECGYPEKPCLRIMLRNGPPFPERPCEPIRAPISEVDRGGDDE